MSGDHSQVQELSCGKQEGDWMAGWRRVGVGRKVLDAGVSQTAVKHILIFITSLAKL